MWRVKAIVERVPGAFRLYKMVTSLGGEGRIYEIGSGPLQGARWRRYNQLPYWYHRGIYEPRISARIVGELQRGDVFWDLGAHAGYHALAAARAVGEGGHVVAVEPEPSHTAILREQMRLNGVQHFTLVEAALSGEVGTATMLRNERDSRISALSGVTTGGVPHTVRTITLDALAEQAPPPVLIKMDIEGAERLVLPGAGAFFSGAHRPRLLLLATHGRETHDICLAALERFGFRVEGERNGELGNIIAS